MQSRPIIQHVRQWDKQKVEKGYISDLDPSAFHQEFGWIIFILKNEDFVKFHRKSWSTWGKNIKENRGWAFENRKKESLLTFCQRWTWSKTVKKELVILALRGHCLARQISQIIEQ